ncbi:DUF3021 family protein [Shouchella lehensis]|uniref:DUF3021 domain-containing protein n=1 Tax=Shouchella lehensis G1 TaxID=1246626 RepID=A0A060M112_9BACI|nr:DUF3021 family protein [Shouchella lehensis]AIC95720.1 hypothetical protein BleG1_3156 [Shouchella lehensis G1]
MLIQILLRGLLPFIIMNVIAIVLYYQNKTHDAKGTFIASFIVLILGIASLIYNIEEWSILRKTVLHFLVMLLTIYPILLVSGWFTLISMKDYFVVFLLFLGFGTVSWLIFFILFKFTSN